MAVDSLRSVAVLLTKAHQQLAEVVHGRPDIPEGASLETVFSAVKATTDVSCSCSGSWGMQLNLPLLCMHHEPSVTLNNADQGDAWRPGPPRGRHFWKRALSAVQGQRRCQTVMLRLQDVHALMSAPQLQLPMAGMQPQGHGCSYPSCGTLTLTGLATTHRASGVNTMWYCE